MTEVLHSPSPSSSPSPSISPQPHNGALYHTRSRSVLGGEEGEIEGVTIVTGAQEAESDTEEDRDFKERENKERRDHHLSLLALLVTLVRKSFWMACNTTTTGREELCGRPAGTPGVMEIGWPTDVRHVSHVTFDRFNGFLGLPVEFEPEVPRRPPSARCIHFPFFLCLGFLKMWMHSYGVDCCIVSVHFLGIRVDVLSANDWIDS